MSIPHSILALLSNGPTHGYALKTRFDSITANEWPLNVGQVYSTLRRLERDGLVAPHGKPKDSQQAWKLTSTGRKSLGQWFEQPVINSPPSRNELAIKILIAITAERSNVNDIIQNQRTATMAQLQKYTRFKRDADSDESWAWVLALDAMILRAESEIRWLDLCEARIKKRK